MGRELGRGKKGGRAFGRREQRKEISQSLPHSNNEKGELWKGEDSKETLKGTIMI